MIGQPDRASRLVTETHSIPLNQSRAPNYSFRLAAAYVAAVSFSPPEVAGNQIAELLGRTGSLRDTLTTSGYCHVFYLSLADEIVLSLTRQPPADQPVVVN
jgi:hypothetical protein